MERVMTKAVWGAAAAAAVLFVASPVFAQATDTKTLNVSATVSARAKLTLSSAAVSFADADPDLTPSIVATPLTVDVKTRTAAASNVTLTVLAGGDLMSGSDPIAITNLTWTASGAGVSAGTMSKTTAVTFGDVDRFGQSPRADADLRAGQQLGLRDGFVRRRRHLHADRSLTDNSAGWSGWVLVVVWDVFVWLWAVLAATPVAAQSQTSNATISVNVGTLANLTVSSTSVSFPDADPDAVPQVNALGGPLTIATKARATRGSQVRLTVQANGPLRSGLNTIAAGAITWTTTGAGFVAGTLELGCAGHGGHMDRIR